ncbi:MAG TPA: hydrogenase iron-sulfur subunit [Anaerolineae bacterium]|nr:hydrogenase iron-sulfur subunit [Anaerolineae bacterium]
MKTDKEKVKSKILILATLSGGYLGADSAGQGNKEYAPNVYIFSVMTAAIFPPEFYIRALEKSVDAIIVMYSGSDCPYKGAAEHTAKMISQAYEMMKERGMDQRRLRLSAICTVCVDPFLEEVAQANELLDEIGPIERPVPAVTEAESVTA